MRTTLKRGIGRGAELNGSGNGRAVLPPAIVTSVSRYRQPPPPRHGVLFHVGRMLLWLVATTAVVVTGLAGGFYLYVDEEVVAKVRAHSKEVRAAAKVLDIVPAGQPAIALVVGYDKRAFGAERALTGRSDTIMLVRADPQQHALSMLSFPRDLLVEIRCPGRPASTGRINSAYSDCGGPVGTLETVRALTGLPINYLITVNFRGFKQMVAQVGGVWVDVDRRYFNDNSRGEGYAAIDLQPGYQKLNGQDALDFVRYRHTDSDLYRLARQQQFVGAFRQAITSSFSPTNIPKIVKTITDNVEVGTAGDEELDKKTIWSYALFAYQLPGGRIYRSTIEGLGEDSAFNIVASPDSVKTAVEEFANPDVEAPAKATDVALGRKPRTAAGPPARDVSLVVLNGNGVPGAAANGSFLLGKLGYRAIGPPEGVLANAASSDYFHTKVYYDRRQEGAEAAAAKVAKLFGSADVERLPPEIRPMQNGAMLVVVVGQTFDGTLAPAPVDKTPQRQEAAVVKNPDATLSLLRQAQAKVRFPLLVPTVIEKTSFPDRSVPLRVYRVAGGRPAVRLVFSTGASEFWGVQMTSWEDAPVLGDPNTVLRPGGRRLELHYSGPKLHMVVVRERGATYWVVNTVLNRLSNETMLAIAKGLKPLQ